jgi:hypothetical protein
MITPCFRVTAVGDTGVEYEGHPGNSSESPAHEGNDAFWFWPPVAPRARQLRVTVSTLREAAWALIDILAANPSRSPGEPKGPARP